LFILVNFSGDFEMKSRIFCVMGVAVVGLVLASSASADYATAVSANNPFMWYRMQETNVVPGTTAAVNSGSSGVNGLYTDNGTGGYTDVTTPAGDVGKDWNPTDTTHGPYIAAGAQGSTYEAMNAFSWECLVQPNWENQLDAWAMIYANTSNGTPGDSQACLTTSAGYEGLEVWVSGIRLNADIREAVPTGQWGHLAATFQDNGDGTGTITAYANGIQVNQVTGSFTIAPDLSTGLDLGGWNSGYVATPFRFLQSGFDEFAMYDTALSAADIYAHAEAAGLVPEPGTMTLVTIGLFGLIAYAWRKRR
jgi:hypothetical protein